MSEDNILLPDIINEGIPDDLPEENGTCWNEKIIPMFKLLKYVNSKAQEVLENPIGDVQDQLVALLIKTATEISYMSHRRHSTLIKSLGVLTEIMNELEKAYKQSDITDGLEDMLMQHIMKNNKPASEA